MRHRLPILTLAIFLLFPAIIYSQHSIYAWKKYDHLRLAGWSEKKIKKLERKLNPKQSGAFMVIHKGKVVMTWGNYERRFHADAIKKTFASDVVGANISSFSSRGMSAPKGRGPRVAAAQMLQHDLTAYPGKYGEKESANKLFPLKKYETPRPYSTRKKIKKKNKFGFYQNERVNGLAVKINSELDTDIVSAYYSSIAYNIRMEDFRLMDGYLHPSPTFGKSPDTTDFYFKISARDLARVGQLYLQKGLWKVFDYSIYDKVKQQQGMWVDESVLPEFWVNNSITSYSASIPKMSSSVGYGYHWWINIFTDSTDNYATLGRGGQLLAVFPKHKIVIVHLSNTYKSDGISFGRLKKLVKGVFKAKGDSVWATPPETFLGEVLGDKPNIIPTSKNVLKQYIGDYDVVHIEEEELAERMEVEEGDETQSVKKITKTPKIPKAERLKVKVVMKRDENRLLMETSWMGKYYLLPIGKDLFLWEDARYQMSFIRDKNGKIDYVRIEGTE